MKELEGVKDKQILCVGGVLDGRRVEYRGRVVRSARHHTRLLACGPEIRIPETTTLEFDEYIEDRLVLADDDGTRLAFVFYRLSSLKYTDVFKRLIDGYKP